MFLFRGGQAVEKGTYWFDKGKKVMLKKNGFLPGNKGEWYFKLPESYLLIPMSLLALVLSMAFPYGMGAAVFALMYIFYRILFSLTSNMGKLLSASDKKKGGRS